jgi:hypothetical protein
MAAVSTYQSPSLFLAKHDTMEFAEGIPDQLHSPLAWTRDEVESLSSHWIVKLEDSEVAQVDKALASFEAKYKDLSKASKETFKLPPSLAWRLKQISHQCYQGIGFAIVRGLNPANYSPKQNLAIYAGISAYVAPQRGYIDRAHQKIQSDTFHSDGCEILSLYAQDLEPEGGRTLLSSSWQLYNDLAGKDPNSTPLDGGSSGRFPSSYQHTNRGGDQPCPRLKEKRSNGSNLVYTAP